MATKVLLVCGILSSLLYAIANVIVPMQAVGYDPVTQTISELSAVEAPTRGLWSIVCAPYTPLVTAFAIGILLAAGNRKGLRWTAYAILAFGALGFIWPFAPMHTREVLAAGGGDFRDTVHIALGILSALLMFGAVVAASKAFSKGFFIYSMTTLVALAFFGALMGKESPNIPVDGPTPMLGVWERIELGVFDLWIIVLAGTLLTRGRSA